MAASASAADRAPPAARRCSPAGGAADGTVAAVAFGDAAALVLAREQAMRADLVVIGKRRGWLLADFLLVA